MIVDIDTALAEAEKRERLPADRSTIRQMAERMAAERREKLRRANLLVRHAPATAAAPIQMTATPAPVRVNGKRRHRSMGLKSLRILKVLKKLREPKPVAALARLLPDIEYASLCAYLSNFVSRKYAVRDGVEKSYRYGIGPNGVQYLQIFHPPD